MGEQPLKTVPAGDRQFGSLVNSAATVLFTNNMSNVYKNSSTGTDLLRKIWKVDTTMHLNYNYDYPFGTPNVLPSGKSPHPGFTHLNQSINQ